MHIFLTFLFLVNGFSIHTAPKKAIPKQPTQSEVVRNMVITADIRDIGGRPQQFVGTLEKFIAFAARPQASLPVAAAGGEGSLQAPTVTFLPTKIQHQNELEECVRREIEQEERKEFVSVKAKNTEDIDRCFYSGKKRIILAAIEAEEAGKRNGIKGSMIQDRKTVELAVITDKKRIELAAAAIFVSRGLEPEETFLRKEIEGDQQAESSCLMHVERAELCPIAMADLAQANVRVRRLGSSLAKIKEDVVAGKEMLYTQQEEISKKQAENVTLQARFNILKRNMAHQLRAFKARIKSKNNLLGEKNEQLAQLRSDFAQTSALLAAATTDAQDLQIRTVAFEEDRDNLNGLFAEACFQRDEALLARFRVEQRYASIADAMGDLLQEVTVATSGFIDPAHRQMRDRAAAVRRAIGQDPSSFVQ